MYVYIHDECVCVCARVYVLDDTRDRVEGQMVRLRHSLTLARISVESKPGAVCVGVASTLAH